MANRLSDDGTAYKSSNFGTYCLLFSALHVCYIIHSWMTHWQIIQNWTLLQNHPFMEFDLTSSSLHASMYRKSTTSRA